MLCGASFQAGAAAGSDEKHNGRGFDHLIEEQTSGGYNEMAFASLENSGVFAALEKTLDAVSERWQGKPPGP